MGCEMCGKDTNLFLASVEGCELKVCKVCAKHGKILRSVRPNTQKKNDKPRNVKFEIKPKKERILVFIPEFSKLIKEKREKMGLKQKELAKMLAEKESVIHKLESGNIEPSLNLARKLERQLRIKIIEQHELGKEDNHKYKSKRTVLTIGDLISVKKK